jgi:hypothetical protein
LHAKVKSQKQRAADRSKETLNQLQADGSLTDSKVKHLFFYARTIWSDYLIAAPELAAVACGFLSISPSEASVERSFSLHGIVHSKRRINLSDKHAQNELQIKFNRRALASNTVRIGFHAEMTENSEHSVPRFGHLALQIIESEQKRDLLDSLDESEGEIEDEADVEDEADEDDQLTESDRGSEDEHEDEKMQSFDTDNNESVALNDSCDSDDASSQSTITVAHRESSIFPAAQAATAHRARPAFSMRPAPSLGPMAMEFIDQEKLSKPTRFNEKLSIKLTKFIKDRDHRVPEVALTRRINQLLKEPQQLQPQQSQQSQQSQQPQQSEQL